jgi:hypothetical protein
VAAAHGLEVGETRVLSDRSNLIVELAPAGVVARVATSTADTRAGGAREWLARDVTMASWLAERGPAVVPPATELPPGPHLEDGLAITFWRQAQHDRSAPASPREAGEALRALHEALAEFPGELPPFAGLLDECGRLVERLKTAGPAPAIQRIAAALDRLRSTIDAAGLPVRPLHGDASPSNLLRTPGGLLWTDFEDCCSGPVEWDLTCLASSSGPDAAAALEAYGAPGPALEPFLEARRLQGALWTALLAERHPHLRARAAARLREWEAPE